MTTVIIEQTGGTKVEIENRKSANVVINNEHRIVVIGTGGGPASLTTTRAAAETVSALRLLSERTDGVHLLDPHDDASVAGMLGVGISAGDAGDTIRIKTLSGDFIDDAGWSWVPGFVYAGPAGTLTQSLPQSGWEIVVGYAPSPTRLNLTFDEPLKLA